MIIRATRMLISSILLTYACLGFAVVNPITVTYSNGNTSFATGVAGSANYVVAVNPGVIPANVPLTFNLTSTGSSPGLTASQQTTGLSPCTNVATLCPATFSLSAGQSCCLAFSLTSDYAGPYSLQPCISTIPGAYPAEAPSATPITVSVAQTSLTAPTSFALSVNCQPSSGCTGVQNAALTGNARTFTIVNSPTNAATGLSVSASGLPSGTSVTNTTCTGTIAAGQSCTVTITPGSVPSSSGGTLCSTGIAPTPATITVSANNALSVTTNVVVLTYGCQYQSGYVYSVNDSTPTSGSVGGKIAALLDSVAGQTSITNAAPNWGGFGCDIGSSLWDNATQGANDGSTNSSATVSALTTNSLSLPCSISPVALADYAAGICSQYTTPSDAGLIWYLPSICELSGISPSSNCTSGTTSMLNQLRLLSPAVGGFVNTGYYWSSTEYAHPSLARLTAWCQRFSSGGSQNYVLKYYLLGVRCSRALSL